MSSYQHIMNPVRDHVADLPESIKDVRENTLLRTLLSEACMSLSKDQRAELEQFAIDQIKHFDYQDKAINIRAVKS